MALEWRSKQTQNLLGLGPWGFKSLRGHQLLQGGFRVSAFCPQFSLSARYDYPGLLIVERQVLERWRALLICGKRPY